MPQAKPLEILKDKKIVSAQSDLSNLCINFENELVLHISACLENRLPVLNALCVLPSDCPYLGEAGCSVEWSWILDSLMDEFILSPSSIRLILRPAGPLTVSTAVWQGSPFLSFLPFRPP